jgi:hypothetical protein
MSAIKPRYVAQKYVASSPDVKLVGGVLLALQQETGVDDIKPLLQTYDLSEIDPNQWYPQQLLLDFYKAIAEMKFNSKQNLTGIGIQFMSTIPIDPKVKTFKEAIEFITASIGTYNQNVPEEEKFTVPVYREGYAIVISNMPYPDDVLYGYIWAIAKRFCLSDGGFSVRYIDNPDPDQHPGVAYEVTWGND